MIWCKISRPPVVRLVAIAFHWLNGVTINSLMMISQSFCTQIMSLWDLWNGLMCTNCFPLSSFKVDKFSYSTRLCNHIAYIVYLPVLTLNWIRTKILSSVKSLVRLEPPQDLKIKSCWFKHVFGYTAWVCNDWLTKRPLKANQVFRHNARQSFRGRAIAYKVNGKAPIHEVMPRCVRGS